MKLPRACRSTMLACILSAAAVAAAPSEAAAAGFSHAKIDSSAQLALSAIASEGGDGAREAAMILGAVQAGALGGVYLADQGVPALRAKKFDTNWWSLHPKGIDGVVLPPHPSEPGTRPILVLRKSVAANSAARKAALRDAFATFALMQAQTISPCSGGQNAVSTVAGKTHCVTSSSRPPYVKLPEAIEIILDRAHPWGTDYVKAPVAGKEPACARSFAKYSICKTQIGKPKPPGGNELFPLQNASAYESGGGKPTTLTRSMLLHIMSPSLVGDAQQIAKKKQNLDAALPQLKRTFEMFGFDTVRSQAHFLAHYGGELGGDPGNFGIVETFTELSCRESNKEEFLGRGPLQVTCRVAYVLALAYLELRHDQLIVEKVNKALLSNPTSVWNTFVDAVNDVGVKSLAKAHRAIKADPDAAGQFSNGFVLSGAYWHAAGCGKDMVKLAKIPNVVEGHFIGAQPGSRCVSGGGVSDSGDDRADEKACIYNVAMKSLQSGKAESHACMAKYQSSSSAGTKKKRPKLRRRHRRRIAPSNGVRFPR